MNQFMVKVNRGLRKTGLFIKKHSPEILVVAGAAGSVGAIVIACKETLKLEETLDDCNTKKAAVEDSWNDIKENCPSEYDEKLHKKDICKVTISNAWSIFKLYAPAAGLEIASLSIIFASNGIQRKRNAQLAAAYATLDAMYKKYRANVVEAYGEDVDKELLFGLKKEKLKVTEIDENGNEKEVTKKVETIDYDPNDPSNLSMYARFYDKTCSDYDPYPGFNVTTLKARQEYANQLLITNGYMFLNDIYDMLGFDRTDAGQCVGWVYDEDSPFDNHIDFGIYEVYNSRAINGLEPVVLLDFNVDGDLINNKQLNTILRKKIKHI